MLSLDPCLVRLWFHLDIIKENSNEMTNETYNKNSTLEYHTNHYPIHGILNDIIISMNLYLSNSEVY